MRILDYFIIFHFRMVRRLKHVNNNERKSTMEKLGKGRLRFVGVTSKTKTNTKLLLLDAQRLGLNAAG